MAPEGRACAYAAWRRPRRLRLRRPGGPAARRSACVLHAVAMFVQQQVAVVVACVWRVPAVVCVREELLLLERAIAAPVLSRPSARTLRSRFNSQRACYTAAGIGGATVTHGGAISPYRSTPTSLLLQTVRCRARRRCLTVFLCQGSFQNIFRFLHPRAAPGSRLRERLHQCQHKA